MGILVKKKGDREVKVNYANAGTFMDGMDAFFYKAVGPRDDSKDHVLKYAYKKLGIIMGELERSPTDRRWIKGQIDEVRDIIDSLEGDLRHLHHLIGVFMGEDGQ